MSSNDNPPVLKLAQRGFDVHTAGDENLIYSSKWPVLKIAKQGVLTFDFKSKPLVSHELGYPAFFWTFNNTTDTILDGGGLVAPASVSSYSGDGTMTDKEFYLEPDPATLYTGTRRLYYYIYALDLTKKFTAPIIDVGNIPGFSDDSRVFKITKENKDISSDNLQDFIIHSRCRTPLIHSVNPGKVADQLPSGAFGFSVNHGLDYVPMFWGFTKNPDGSYSQLPTGTGGSSQFTNSKGVITYEEAAAGRELTIVVLKDPFVISATRQVVVS